MTLEASASALKGAPTHSTDEPPRPVRYDVRQPLPPGLPYDEFYKEKIPLLRVFQAAAAEAAARSTATRLGALRRALGLGAPMVAAECGVYQGYSLIACGQIAQALGIPLRFVGLDSFAGLPTPSEDDRRYAPATAPYLSRQMFDDVSYETVRQRIEEAGLSSSVTLVKGFFADTLPTLTEQTYDFVNIDCDLYEPHLECLGYFYPRVRPGGVLFFDDYHSQDFPMAKHAIDRFLSGRPERLLHLRYGDDGVNHTKAYIVKF